MSKTTAIDARIGLNVRTLRALRGVNQVELAALMTQSHPTWSRATVSAIERGHRAVLVSEALDLAAYLDVDLAKLLSDKLLSI